MAPVVPTAQRENTSTGAARINASGAAPLQPAQAARTAHTESMKDSD